MDWTQLQLFWPVGVIVLTALVVVGVDVVIKHADRYVLPWLGMGGCAVALALTLTTPVPIYFHAHGEAALALNGAFALDGFGLAIWVVATLAGALSILSSSHNPSESPLSTGEYYGLILLAVSGMMLLGVSHDFLTLLISLEIMSIATYILTGSNRDEARSHEAALKYLVLGAFSTAFLLMGIAFFYGATGSISLAAVNPGMFGTNGSLVVLAMGLIFVGALFKVGAAPFHFWIPDVYQGAPAAITGLMAVGVKAAAIAVLGRFAFETFGSAELRALWLPALEVIAVATMAVGNILAMRQQSVKRMLAYSGIAHTGYLALGLLVAAGSGASATTEHLRAINFYLLIYGVMSLGAFAVLGLSREDGKPLETLSDFRGLARSHPGLALCMAMFMFSAAGLPPFGGFFAKFLIFRGAIQEGYVVAAVLGILTSVASLYYYLSVVVQMYMSPANDEAGAHEAHGAKHPLPVHVKYSWASDLLIYAAGAVTLLLGLLPSLAAKLLPSLGL